MTYHIRSLSEQDRNWLLDIASYDTIHNDLGKPELYNREQLDNLFTTAQHGDYSFVCEMNGELIGIVSGIQHGHLFNPDVQLISTLFWYVAPAFRNSRAGWLLLKRYTDAVKASGLNCIFAIQNYSNVKPSIFHKAGFTDGEQVFKYERT